MTSSAHTNTLTSKNNNIIYIVHPTPAPFDKSYLDKDFGYCPPPAPTVLERPIYPPPHSGRTLLRFVANREHAWRNALDDICHQRGWPLPQYIEASERRGGRTAWKCTSRLGPLCYEEPLSFTARIARIPFEWAANGMWLAVNHEDSPYSMEMRKYMESVQRPLQMQMQMQREEAHPGFLGHHYPLLGYYRPQQYEQQQQPLLCVLPHSHTQFQHQPHYLPAPQHLQQHARTRPPCQHDVQNSTALPSSKPVVVHLPGRR